MQKVISVEPEVTRFDIVVGDGDCGNGLERGAEKVLDAFEDQPAQQDLVLNMLRLVQAVENSMDGTSGALYAIFLNSLAHHLRGGSEGGKVGVTAAFWSTALKQGLTALEQYTPAKAGDRTLIDALAPFVETLSQTGSLKAAADAAWKGAEATKGMKASLGRTVYVGGDGYKEVPDPGAYGLAALLTGFAEAAC